MSILRICTHNLLDAVEAANRTIPATAARYDWDAMMHSGGIGRPWQTANFANQWLFTFDFLADRPIDFCAIFDVRPSSGTIDQVRLLHSLTGSVYTEAGSLALNERGDGSLSLPFPVEARYWRVVVDPSEASQLVLGGLWLGLKDDLPNAYARRRDAPDYGVHQIRAESRSVSTWELGDYIEQFTLGWDRLDQVGHAAVLEAFHACRGGRKPLVILPDASQPSRVHHGRIGNALPFEVDFPMYGDLAWEFVESGRSLGGR